MLSKLLPLKLSRDEEIFLRHWVFDEMHYQAGQGPAKRLQLEHEVAPADIAVLVAAAMPDPLEQETVGVGPPPLDPPAWPWTDEIFAVRLAEARTLLSERRRDRLKITH